MVGAETANKGLELIRTFLDEVDERTGIKSIPYRVVAYECDDINGFSIKQGGEYIIGISIKTVDDLYRWFRTWFSCEETYNALDLNKDRKEIYIQKAYEYALCFLAAHENYHIKNGHCDLPEMEERFIFEQSQEIEKENAIFRQVLEYDADSCATACCINQILYKYEKYDEIKVAVQLQMFAIYSIFKIFSQYEQFDFDAFIEEDLTKYDHANAGIRFIVSQCVMSTLFLDKRKEIVDLCEVTVSDTMRFEHEVLKIDNAKETLFGIAYTEKGDNHIVRLHNSWETVRKKLLPYTHCELAEFEPIHGGNVFVDKKGKWCNVERKC